MGTILLILAKSQNFYRLSFKWRCNQKWNVVLNPNPYSIWEPTYAFSCLLENTFYRSFTEITCEKFLIISWTTNPSQFRNYVWYQHLGCPRSKIIGNWLKAINYFISGWYGAFYDEKMFSSKFFHNFKISCRKLHFFLIKVNKIF